MPFLRILRICLLVYGGLISTLTQEKYEQINPRERLETVDKPKARITEHAMCKDSQTS